MSPLRNSGRRRIHNLYQLSLHACALQKPPGFRPAAFFAAKDYCVVRILKPRRSSRGGLFDSADKAPDLCSKRLGVQSIVGSGWMYSMMALQNQNIAALEVEDIIDSGFIDRLYSSSPGR
jgi:hypothetical protein